MIIHCKQSQRCYNNYVLKWDASPAWRTCHERACRRRSIRRFQIARHAPILLIDYVRFSLLIGCCESLLVHLGAAPAVCFGTRSLLSPNALCERKSVMAGIFSRFAQKASGTGNVQGFSGFCCAADPCGSFLRHKHEVENKGRVPITVFGWSPLLLLTQVSPNAKSVLGVAFPRTALAVHGSSRHVHSTTTAAVSSPLDEEKRKASGATGGAERKYEGRGDLGASLFDMSGSRAFITGGAQVGIDGDSSG